MWTTGGVGRSFSRLLHACVPVLGKKLPETPREISNGTLGGWPHLPGRGPRDRQRGGGAMRAGRGQPRSRPSAAS